MDLNFVSNHDGMRVGQMAKEVFPSGPLRKENGLRRVVLRV